MTMENQDIAKSYRSQETTLKAVELGMCELAGARPDLEKSFAPRAVSLADPAF